MQISKLMKMDHIIKNIYENKIVTLFELGTLNNL